MEKVRLIRSAKITQLTLCKFQQATLKTVGDTFKLTVLFCRLKFHLPIQMQ